MDVDEKTREMNAVDARCRVLEDENLALKQEIDEKDAVIDKVRGIEKYVATRKAQHYERWNDTDDPMEADRCGVYADVLDRLNAVDGL